jgi:hypothetical protein
MRASIVMGFVIGVGEVEDVFVQVVLPKVRDFDPHNFALRQRRRPNQPTLALRVPSAMS